MNNQAGGSVRKNYLAAPFVDQNYFKISLLFWTLHITSYNHTSSMEPLSTQKQINYSERLRCINCLKRWILDGNLVLPPPFPPLHQFCLNLIPLLYNRTFQGVLELIVLQCWLRRQKSALPIVPWFCHFWEPPRRFLASVEFRI